MLREPNEDRTHIPPTTVSDSTIELLAHVAGLSRLSLSHKIPPRPMASIFFTACCLSITPEGDASLSLLVDPNFGAIMEPMHPRKLVDFPFLIAQSRILASQPFSIVFL